MDTSSDTIESENIDDLKALGYKEILKRNSEILELYRQGKTLQAIGTLFGITRERVRQIVKVTIRQSAINESALKGVDIDTEIFSDGISKKRKFVQESKRIAQRPKIIPKEHRWSRYYLACRSCGTISIPHVRKGLCEECLGIFRAERREEIITANGSKCANCNKSRTDARVDYGRDLFITKDRRVLCRSCFRNNTGKLLGSYSHYKWSRLYPACISCGKDSLPHVKGGLCENCSGIYSERQREGLIKDHSSRCDNCHTDRGTAQLKQGKDLFVTRKKEVFCKDCFQRRTAKDRFLKK